MRTSFSFWSRPVVAGVLVFAALLRCPPTAEGADPNNGTEPGDKVDRLVRQLHAPEGKVKYLFSINPGGPVFELSVPMRKLVQQSNAIQRRLLPQLKDPRIRNEVALILARIGDKDALPHLIGSLPAKAYRTQEEAFSTMCLLYALWQLTGMELGINHKFGQEYSPKFRKQWQAWYESNKDYLYTPAMPKPASWSWGRDRVLVDIEAKLTGQPTTTYRKEHPWIGYEEIKTWRNDRAYEQKLKDYCFSVILNRSWNGWGHAPAETVRALGRIQAPRALTALHALCELVKDVHNCGALVWALEERGDPSSIPFLAKIPRSKKVSQESNSSEWSRLRAIERIQLLNKYRKELKGKAFDSEQKIVFSKCLESPKGVDALLEDLRSRENDSSLSDYLQVAGYMDQKSVRAGLKQMARDTSRDEPARTMVHGALARLGEKDSLAHLKRSLTHKHPGVRLAAAESLWRLGNREGFQTLVKLLDLRPIESGRAGVQVGGGAIGPVTAITGSNVETIRSSCTILGEMGDRRAIKPLKRLLALNLNGVLATDGSGTGWSGRPDVVALAKLGDFSGIAVLRASIRKRDPLDVVGSWGGTGDFVKIRLKRFIPELLPVFENGYDHKRVQAAQAILLLLEGGR
jgi:HEAT repeat protein